MVSSTRVISLLGTNSEMTLGDLSRELELSHSTVSGIVDRLQAKGLVVRKPSPNDRRYVQISLAEHVASQAPALGDEGPIGRLEAVLKAATAEERRKVQEVWCYSCDSQIKPGYCLQSRKFCNRLILKIHWPNA